MVRFRRVTAHRRHEQQGLYGVTVLAGNTEDEITARKWEADVYRFPGALPSCTLENGDGAMPQYQ